MASTALELLMTLKDQVSDKLDDVKKALGETNKSALALGLGGAVAVGAFAAGLSACVDAAADEEVGIKRLETAVNNSGASWGDASDEIDAYLAAETKRVALDDGEGRESLTKLTTATGDYKKAMDLLPIAIDLAAARNIDLSTATDIVGKVYIGNTGILERYGIKLADNSELEKAHTAATKAEDAALKDLAEAQTKAQDALTKYGPSSAQYLAAQGAVKEAQEKATAATAAQRQATLDVNAAYDASGTPLEQLSAKIKGQGEAYASTAQGGMKQFDIQMGNIKETIGAFLLPVLVSLFTWLSDLAATAIPLVQQAMGFLKENADIIIPVLAAMGLTITIGLIPAFTAWATAAATTAAATIAALAPVLLPIAAVGAAVALLAVAWKNDWGGIQEKTQAVLDFIMPYINMAVEFIRTTITTVMNGVRDFWDQHGQQIMAIAQTVWSMVQNTIQTVIGVVKGIIDLFLSVLRGDWQGAWDAILGIIRTIWNGIQTQIQLVGDLIGEYLTLLWSLISDAVETAWNAIKGVISGVWDGIKGVVSGAVDGVRIAMGTAWNTIYNAAGTAFGNIKKAITGPIEDGVGVISGLVGRIIDAFMSIGRIHIPMPHFNWSTHDVTLAGITFPVPDIGISWYGQGMQPTLFTQPTLIGVGERGAEVVSVTPAGQAGAAGTSFSFVYNDYGGGGAGRQTFEQISRHLEFRYRYGL